MEKNKNVSYFLRQSAVGLASVSAAFLVGTSSVGALDAATVLEPTTAFIREAVREINSLVMTMLTIKSFRLFLLMLELRHLLQILLIRLKQLLTKQRQLLLVFSLMKQDVRLTEQSMP